MAAPSQLVGHTLGHYHIMEQIGGLNYQAKDFDDFKNQSEKHLGVDQPKPAQSADDGFAIYP